MKNKTTLYHFILDSSGSMHADQEKTIHLFNRQVATVKSLAAEFKEQEFLTSLTTFNDFTNHIVQESNVSELKELTADMYRPDGLTALYDAIGESVDRIREQYKNLLANNEMSVVMIILTDGHENASRKYGVGDIGRMIKTLEETGKWTFTILGADFDIRAVSSHMNFRSSASLNYDKAYFCEMTEDIEESIRYYAKEKSKGHISKDFFQKKERNH